jgi:hypothetical protein
MKKVLIARIAVSLLLIGMLSAPATPQGGCVEYSLWGLSGFAGDISQGPGGDPSWQQLVAQAEANHGELLTCTYAWYNDTYYSGHWEGSCGAHAYACPSNPPTPPPSAPAEVPLSCPSCVGGQPINLTNGNTYIQQTDVQIPGIGGGLVLARTWNSIWPSSQSGLVSGLFGPNWRSTYEERVFVGTDGTLKYARADGSFWSFFFF